MGIKVGQNGDKSGMSADNTQEKKPENMHKSCINHAYY